MRDLNFPKLGENKRKSFKFFEAVFSLIWNSESFWGNLGYSFRICHKKKEKNLRIKKFKSLSHFIYSLVKFFRSEIYERLVTRTYFGLGYSILTIKQNTITTYDLSGIGE